MTIRYEYDFAWDAGARTVATLLGDGCFTFSVPKSAIGVVCGLNSSNQNVSKNEIEFGFFIDRGRYAIIESGSLLTSLQSFPFDNTLFKIERVNEEIRYYTDEAVPC
jgi:hypothetical protein